MPRTDINRLNARDEIRDALYNLNAREINIAKASTGTGYVTFSLYSIRGRVAILSSTWEGQTQTDMRLVGCDIFIPAIDSNRINETIAALRAWADGTAHTPIRPVDSEKNFVLNAQEACAVASFIQNNRNEDPEPDFLDQLAERIDNWNEGR